MQKNVTQARDAAFAGSFVRRNRLVMLPLALCCVLTMSCTHEATADRSSKGESVSDGDTRVNRPVVVKSAAFGGTLDGQTVYEKGCASCHESGFNGAPRPVASDWPYAGDFGVEHYTRVAIQGVGIMPARGGHPDLTDQQINAAVRYIFDRMGIPTETEGPG